jgi:GntR family transcriptional regulator
MTLIDFPANRPPAIDHASPVPYYAQVKETLRGPIERGDWKAGDQLPGEPELCSMFDVSRTVIRQALTELMYEGLIVRVKGKGTFVAKPKILESLAQKLTGFVRTWLSRPAAGKRILTQQVVPASARWQACCKSNPRRVEIGACVLSAASQSPGLTFLPFSRCADILQPT